MMMGVTQLALQSKTVFKISAVYDREVFSHRLPLRLANCSLLHFTYRSSSLLFSTLLSSLLYSTFFLSFIYSTLSFFHLFYTLFRFYSSSSHL